eukprot:SAG11_NODE_1465_length_4859_cov_9.864916_1_plen_137_part_00
MIGVAEGGGECDLQNFQTLCSPCHDEKTAHDRRTGWTTKAASGTADIRKWVAKEARATEVCQPSQVTPSFSGRGAGKFNASRSSQLSAPQTDEEEDKSYSSPLRKLVEMGFGSLVARRALQQTNGELSEAVAILTR